MSETGNYLVQKLILLGRNGLVPLMLIALKIAPRILIASGSSEKLAAVYCILRGIFD